MHTKYHAALGHILLPVCALEPVQEKEERDFYIPGLLSYTAAMRLGLSAAKTRCSQALPSPTDLFPSMTNIRPVCTSREQTSPQRQLLGRDVVYLSVPCLITLGGTYQNRFSSKWHTKALMKSGLLSDVNHPPFASSKTGEARPKEHLALRHTGKSGLAKHRHKKKSSEHRLLPVLLHFV